VSYVGVSAFLFRDRDFRTVPASFVFYLIVLSLFRDALT